MLKHRPYLQLHEQYHQKSTKNTQKNSTKSTKKNKEKAGTDQSTKRVGEGGELVVEEEDGRDDGEGEEGEDEAPPAFHAAGGHRRR